MNTTGLLIGFFAFIIIGLFHPIVIKCEYYFSEKVWVVFLFAGLGFLFLSTLFSSPLVSSLLGVTGFTCLWSIHELKEQKIRVEKGWFPKNPKRQGRP